MYSRSFLTEKTIWAHLEFFSECTRILCNMWFALETRFEDKGSTSEYFGTHGDVN
jgi:hypothetical protein